MVNPSTNTSANRRPLRLALRVARPLVIAYLCVLLLAMIFERRLVYPAPSIETGDWQPIGLNHEEV